MLVLTRREGERIMVGDDVEIMVCAVLSNGQVRIGVRAPLEVPVHRHEVYEEIQANGERRVA